MLAGDPPLSISSRAGIITSFLQGRISSGGRDQGVIVPGSADTAEEFIFGGAHTIFNYQDDNDICQLHFGDWFYYIF